AVPRGHGMAAILGFTEREAAKLVARVNERTPLYLASVNAPTEVVVSGEDAALALAAEEAHANGAGARRLRVSIPSHCPLMDVVSTRLREAMHSPRLLYVRNHRAVRRDADRKSTRLNSSHLVISYAVFCLKKKKKKKIEAAK